MKKLAGNDVIVLMKAAMSDNAVLKEAQALSSDNFDNDDLLVKYFFKSHPQGFASKSFLSNNRVAISSSIDSLTKIKKEIVNQGLRKAHNLIQNINHSDNLAVELENSVSNFEKDSSFQLQVKASNLLNFLSKYIDGASHKEAANRACKKVNAGKLDEAVEDIRKIFSSKNPGDNIRKAFTTIKQQIGEGFQMCPKGIYQTGFPIPMEISNCRHYCIDARLHPDGTVGCNYLKWLNENLITQEKALNLFDKMDYDKDEIEFMNLDKGVRTKFPKSDEDSQDLRILRDEKLTKDITMKPWEEQLAKQHVKENSSDYRDLTPTKNSIVASDDAIEKILSDIRDVFDENDLDTLEEQIRAAVEK